MNFNSPGKEATPLITRFQAAEAQDAQLISSRRLFGQESGHEHSNSRTREGQENWGPSLQEVFGTGRFAWSPAPPVKHQAKAAKENNGSVGQIRPFQLTDAPTLSKEVGPITRSH